MDKKFIPSNDAHAIALIDQEASFKERSPFKDNGEASNLEVLGGLHPGSGPVKTRSANT